MTIIQLSDKRILNECKFLKAGTVLVPKPQYINMYLPSGLSKYIVTDEDEKKFATIGDNWMIEAKNQQTLY